MPSSAIADRLLAELATGMAADWAPLERRIERLRGRHVLPAEVDRVAKAVATSRARATQRAAGLPRIAYPPELPVSARRADIAALIRKHQVVMLRYFAGLSVEQTAAALGVSAPTVKRAWAFARGWLKEAIEAGRV